MVYLLRMNNDLLVSSMHGEHIYILKLEFSMRRCTVCRMWVEYGCLNGDASNSLIHLHAE